VVVVGASDVLDVVIGLVFVWFLLSLAVSGVNEAFAWLTRLRAKQLWQAVAKVADAKLAPEARLRDLVWRVPVGVVDYRPVVQQGDKSALSDKRRAPKRTVAQPVRGETEDFVQRLYEKVRASVHDTAAEGWRTRISNIPPSLFADALLSLAETVVTRSSLLMAAERLGWTEARATLAASALPVRGGLTQEDLATALPDMDAARRAQLWDEASTTITVDDVEAVVAGNPQLSAAVRRVRDAAMENRITVGVRQAVEDWFSSEMAALSRFYRRQSRKLAAIVAVIIVCVSSADAVRIVDDLWHDRDLRSVMAGQAGSALGNGAQLDAACPPPPTTTPLAAAQDRLACAVGLVSRARRFEGVRPSAVWTEIRREHDPDSLQASDVPSWALHRLPGRVITVVALLLGAGFWYDVLRRLVGLRSLARRDT
jgi:hypothetical protein